MDAHDDRAPIAVALHEVKTPSRLFGVEWRAGQIAQKCFELALTRRSGQRNTENMILDVELSGFDPAGAQRIRERKAAKAVKGQKALDHEITQPSALEAGLQDQQSHDDHRVGRV